MSIRKYTKIYALHEVDPTNSWHYVTVLVNNLQTSEMNHLNSPGRYARGGGPSHIPEVKSGIFLSDIREGAPRNKPTLKVVRTKSGNFKKAVLSESEAGKDGPEDEGTRITSSYARVLLAGSGFLADAVRFFCTLIFCFKMQTNTVFCPFIASLVRPVCDQSRTTIAPE